MAQPFLQGAYPIPVRRENTFPCIYPCSSIPKGYSWPKSCESQDHAEKVGRAAVYYDMYYPQMSTEDKITWLWEMKHLQPSQSVENNVFDHQLWKGLKSIRSSSVRIVLLMVYYSQETLDQSAFRDQVRLLGYPHFEGRLTLSFPKHQEIPEDVSQTGQDSSFGRIYRAARALIHND